MHVVISLLLQSRKFWWYWYLVLTSLMLLHDVMTSYCCQRYAECLVTTLFQQDSSPPHPAAHVQQLNCCVKKCQIFLCSTSVLQVAQMSVLWITGSGLSCSIVSTTDKSMVWMNWNDSSSMFGAVLNSWFLTRLLTSGKEDIEHVSMLKEDISSTACELTTLILSISVTFSVTCLTVTRVSNPVFTETGVFSKPKNRFLAACKPGFSVLNFGLQMSNYATILTQTARNVHDSVFLFVYI